MQIRIQGGNSHERKNKEISFLAFWPFSPEIRIFVKGQEEKLNQFFKKNTGM
jgi:hypothetical protein